MCRHLGSGSPQYPGHFILRKDNSFPDFTDLMHDQILDKEIWTILICPENCCEFWRSFRNPEFIKYYERKRKKAPLGYIKRDQIQSGAQEKKHQTPCWLCAITLMEKWKKQQHLFFLLVLFQSIARINAERMYERR